MPKYLSIFILLSFAPQFSFGQERKLKIIEFNKLKCEQDDGVNYPRVINRIIEQKLSSDTLFIKLGMWATCCVNFIPSASILDDHLILSYIETGTPCECACFYTLVFKIKGIRVSPNKITLRNQVTLKNRVLEYSSEKYEVFPIKYRIVNGDTLDFKDKYGRRQGKWITDDNTLIFKRFGIYERFRIYSDDFFIKSVKLYPSGSVETELIGEKITKVEEDGTDYISVCFTKYFEYFENGSKKKECFSNNEIRDISMQEGTCKEWDKNGILIYEGPIKKSEKQ
jgi:antitoxin component YwqK of YwqJK toxin-antitoxin module